MKQFTKIAVVCALAVSLAACGSSASSTAASSAASSEAASGEAAPAESEAAADFDTDQDITVISREEGSGTRGAFVELTGVEQKIDGKKVDMTTDDAQITNNTAAMLMTVAGDTQAIGYVSLGSLNETVKAVKIEGVEATAQNVADGSYKIARPFNIAYKADGQSDLSKDFIAYVMSAEGQAIINENGYVGSSDAAAYAANGASGKLVVGGSSSVSPVMVKLIEAYKAVNANVDIELLTSDSTTGMTSAIEGTYDIGMASRELKEDEAAACVSVLCVALICAFLLANGLPAMGEIGVLKFLSGTRWKPGADIYGIFPMIVGSVYVTAGALLLGVPVALLTAVYLAFFCPKGLYRVLKPAVELLAGIPSVVYGFFGIVVLVPAVRALGERWDGSGNAMLTASILLAMMILPTIIGVVEPALRAVPTSYYEGALALGATHERSVYTAVVPAAKSGILAGIVLGVGRAMGETMAVIMVAGNQPRMPKGILQGVRTLTGNIVIEMGYATGLHREALIATGVVLFVFILLINLCFSALKRGKKA